MKYEILNIDLPKIKRKQKGKRGSIANPARSFAIENGFINFMGKPCAKGHDGLRYTKGGNCVHCVVATKANSNIPKQRSLENHNRSIAAANAGQKTYIPEKPCKNGHSLRFLNSNNCVQCDKDTLEKHRISRKFLRIKKEYGLTKEQYLKLVELQSSSCKLCGIRKEDSFQLHVDHCHDTNKVRGLLCGKCNQGIGLLNHNPELIRKAALYCEEA